MFTHGFAEINQQRIIELAARERLPTMYGWREFVIDGGLMSYGPNIPVIIRRAASYEDRILKGEKPGDLPIEQPDSAGTHRQSQNRQGAQHKPAADAARPRGRGDRVRRREFIILLGGAAAVWPLAARAASPKQVPRIGVLLFGDEVEFGGLMRAFKTGTAERGYQDARNVQFDVRYSDASAEKLTRNARDLAAASVDVIWVPGSTAAQAAREATAVIPIVFAIVSDRYDRVLPTASQLQEGI